MTLSRPTADDPTPGSSADDLGDADPLEVAREICLSQLSVAPRTRAQLASVLSRRGTDPSVVDDVLDRLEDVRLIDDGAFAASYVSSRRAATRSRRAISHDLRSKGVPAAVVEEALEAIDPQNEAVQARELVTRKLPSTRSQPLEARVRRLVAMLARKGYPGGLSLQVVREALAAEAELDLLERAMLDDLEDPDADLTGRGAPEE